jgi:hypothetical protein
MEALSTLTDDDIVTINRGIIKAKELNENDEI